MSSESHRPTISMFRGILLGTPVEVAPGQPDAIWQISDGRITMPCLVPSSELLDRLLSQSLATHWFQLTDWFREGDAPETMVPIMTSAREDTGENDALLQLPRGICPVEGVRAATLALISGVNIEPLRELVERVFLDRDVCARFWTMPASARHHHAFPGGLAAHSLEVAEDLASQTSLDEHERDLCIAAGLLHDIGKVWSYTPDMFQNTAARAMGHELVGLSRLERDLAILEDSWPDGAYAMRVLLSGCGRQRADGSMPSALVARVKAADQRSCELERSNRAPSRAWKPNAWLQTPLSDLGPAAPEAS